MLGFIGRITVYVFSGTLGYVVRYFQLVNTKKVYPYRPQKSDALRELPQTEELVEFISSEVPVPTQRQFVIDIRPEEVPETARNLLPTHQTRSLLEQIECQLKSLRKDIGELKSIMEADEFGKLEANLEYVIDFSSCFLSSLLLMYTQQIKADRFAVVLEEIERQTGQIQHSLATRMGNITKRIYQNRRDIKSLPMIIDRFREFSTLRYNWLMGMNIRAICSCLRVILPQAHTAFVTRQMQRMQAQNVKIRSLEFKLIRILKRMSATEPKQTKFSWWKEANSHESQIVCETEVSEIIEQHQSQYEQLSVATDRLLKRPRRTIYQLAQESKQSYSLVVEFNEKREIEHIWQLEKKHASTQIMNTQTQIASSTSAHFNALKSV